jgi:A/G-specific adenine glycosylase
MFSQNLLKWYDKKGRKDLPWRHNVSAYKVWVSEIMLQQTQVATVIPYFHRFMSQFPNVQSVAHAHLDEVLSLWAGLGYYARGRNLYKTAQIITSNYEGLFPETLSDLVALPGIGRSTASAILAIAFNQPYPILDANVRRVLARYFQVEGWPGLTSVQEKLWQHSESVLPKKRIADFTQAIMDLGATICTAKKPNCILCPVQQTCQAKQNQLVEKFPYKKASALRPQKKRTLWIMINEQGDIFLERRPEYGIWGGLWSLPESDFPVPVSDIQERFQAQFDLTSEFPEIHHTFSHYHLTLKPIGLKLIAQQDIVRDGQQGKWCSLETIKTLGLPAPIQKFLMANFT